MIFEARAPTRIDLAGGTLDIWPLNLLVRDAVTVNVAIDLYATCRLETRRRPGVRLASRDQGKSISAPSLDLARASRGMDLILEFARHFSPATGFTLETDCTAPAGSGLGGSSALAVALAATLARCTGRRPGRRELVRLCRDLEARVIRIPTGTQDYLAALLGGWNSIRYGPGEPRLERLHRGLRFPESRMLLYYTGRSRASARSNWDIIRRCLDAEPNALRALRGIARAAARMHHALHSGDWAGMARAMRMEWRGRRELSPEVGIGGVEKVIGEAIRAGAAAGKPCGAGGGGCVLLLCLEGRQGGVRKALRRAGGRWIDFRTVGKGVVVKSLDGAGGPHV